MPGFSESLTIEITGDSSQLVGELDRVSERIRQLNQQVESLGNASRGIRGLGTQLASLTGPLTRVSGQLRQVLSLMQQLNGTTIALNVRPALAALAQLAAAIRQVMLLLNNLPGGSTPRAPALPAASGGGGGNPSRQGNSGGGARTARGFSTGGLVTGRSGIDRIPALLTAGEYVVQKAAVDQWGVKDLEQVNQGRKSVVSNHSVTVPAEQTTHQYGEIHLHVQQPFALGDVLRDLQLEGHRLQNRRG